MYCHSDVAAVHPEYLVLFSNCSEPGVVCLAELIGETKKRINFRGKEETLQPNAEEDRMKRLDISIEFYLMPIWKSLLFVP